MPTRQDILDAAERVLRERGVAAATTRHIAEVAGCSEGSLYNHFASKEDLVAQAVGERLAGFPAVARRLPERAGTGDVAANLTEVAALAIGFFRQVAPMLAAMLGNPAALRDCARTVDRQGHGPRWTVRAVTDYLRAEQQLGRVRADVGLEGAALSLVGGCLHQALVAHAWGEDLLALDDADAAREIALAVARGLAQPAPRPVAAAQPEQE